MSRCFPYLRPGWVGTGASREALIEPIKPQRETEKGKAERKEERKEKEERRREKKERKRDKREKEREEGKTNKNLDVVDVNKRLKGYVDAERDAKRGVNGVEQLEKSDLTEEHGPDVGSHKPSYSSDCTQNSNKRKRDDSPTPSGTSGNAIKLRLSKKRKEPKPAQPLTLQVPSHKDKAPLSLQNLGEPISVSRQAEAGSVRRQLDSISVQRKPELIPMQRKPELIPVQKKPESTSVQRKPGSTSVQRKPGSTSVQRKPESTSVLRKPESTSVLRKPESTSVLRKPESTSVLRKPESTSVRRKPESTSVLRKPESTSVLRKPESTSVQRKPESTSVQRRQGSVSVEREPESVLRQPESLSVRRRPDEHVPLQKHKESLVGLPNQKEKLSDLISQKPRGPVSGLTLQRHKDISLGVETTCSTSGSGGVFLPLVSESDELLRTTGDKRQICLTSGASEIPVLEHAHVSSHEKKLRKKNEKHESLIASWIPPLLQAHLPDDDDQDWLFGMRQQDGGDRFEGKKYIPSEDTSSSCCGRSLLWPPRAQYLPETDIYALPYTIPF